MTSCCSLIRSCAGFLCRALCALGFLFIAVGVQASNLIQTENAKPGTWDWGRVNTDANTDIEGYASLASVNIGGTINLHVSTTAANYTINVYRLGWYGGAGGRQMLGPIARTGTQQPMPTATSLGLRECNWSDPYALSIPSDWVSGIYLAKLTALDAAGHQNYIIFTVRDDNRAASADLLYKSSVNTWQAYNGWGGQSLYANYSDNPPGIPAQKVSFNRPYSTYSGGTGDFFASEHNLVRFLEREGYDVTYSTDIDLHEQGYALIAPHKALLSTGHDEYWSYQMKSAAHQARDLGQNLAFFGSNDVYWQVRYEPSTLPSAAANRTMVAYKEKAETDDPYWLDSDPTNNKYVTTRFRDLSAPPYNVVDSIAQPENGLIGVMYKDDPVQGAIVISDASHWIFANAGASNGMELPGLLGYEVDAIFNNGYTPQNLQTLATSPYPAGGSHPAGISHMTTYTAASGAVVFATGSIQWSWGLDDYGVPWGRADFTSSVAQQATRNVLARMAIIKPGAPLNPVAIRGNAKAKVTFSAPASNGGGVITGYTVISNPPGGHDDNAGSTALIHTVSGLTNGTPYTFTVTATNIAGTGPQSLASNSVTPSTVPVAPDPPTAVTASSGNAQATVTFVAPIDNGGAAIDGYTVSSQPPGGVDLQAGMNVLTHVVNNLNNGVAYTFTVTAHNSAGNGLASVASNAVTPFGPPGKPGMGTAVAANGQAFVYFYAPASNGGSPITGYTATSSPEGHSSTNCTASPCTVTGLTNGTAYVFRVSATNAAGPGPSSDPSATVIPTALTTSGGWQAGPSLQTARKSHSATLLVSGKLLVTGGSGDTSALASTELYDPATRTWSSGAALGTARQKHSATLLPSGKVLVVGGLSGSALAGAELFDPVANTWSPVGSLSAARHSHAATLLANGKVMVTGGENGAALLSSAELYDPSTNTWSVAGTMGATHELITATLLANGKVLVTGGWGSKRTELYNPGDNSWSNAADLPTTGGQYGATASLLKNSGKVLLAGGFDSSNYLTSGSLYDPGANTWAVAADMLSARELHTATALLNGKVFMAGGVTTAGNLAGSELYSPPENSWAGAGALATGRIYHTATVLARGQVAVIGGQFNNAALSSMELYDPGVSQAAPGAPLIGGAVGGDRQATVTFSAPSDDGGSAITGYTVVSNPAGGTDTHANSTALSHVVTGLSNGTAYTFTVTAVNALGTGLPSAPSNSVTPAAAPIATTGVATAITATGATLNGSVTANGSATSIVFDYGTSNAYGSQATASPSTTPANFAGNATASPLGLTCNTTYHFRIRATNSAGSTNGSDASFTTTSCTPGVPGPPTIVSISPGPGSATISFTPPSVVGNSNIISYTATCSAPGHASRSASSPTSPITVSGLAGGVVYTCTVVATNSAGSSAASSAMPVTPKPDTTIIPILLLLLLD